MISIKDVSYTPLINQKVKIITTNLIVEGCIIFESQKTVIISSVDKKRQILKSAITELYFFDEELHNYVLIHPRLIKGTLVYRVKKMKF